MLPKVSQRSCHTHVQKSLENLYYLDEKVIHFFMQNVIARDKTWVWHSPCFQRALDRLMRADLVIRTCNEISARSRHGSFGNTDETSNVLWMGLEDQERPLRESSAWAESEIFVEDTQAMPPKRAIWSAGAASVNACRWVHADELKVTHSCWKESVGQIMERNEPADVDRWRKVIISPTTFTGLSSWPGTSPAAQSLQPLLYLRYTGVRSVLPPLSMPIKCIHVVNRDYSLP